jgi:glycerophosphoryl diester phosphodiesterase
VSSVSSRPLVIAHRGASSELPENTIPAFERAIELGSDYVEFDVRTDPGGTLVVSHGRVRSPTPDVPTLDEVLETCRARVGLAVEIKEARATERTLAALETHRVADESVIVVSFLPRVVLETRRRRPELRTVQHVDYFPLRAAAQFAWAAGIREGRSADRAIRAAHRLGLAATVYTVNDESRMRELADLGVAGIFTDRPDLLRAVVGG